MGSWMKPLGGWWVVFALLLVLAISLTFSCTSSSPKKYQLGFLSSHQKFSKTGCLFEHDLLGGTHQNMAKEDWENN